MRKRILHTLWLIALAAVFIPKAYAGIGEIGPPSPLKEIKKEGDEATPEPAFGGGIGKIGSPFAPKKEKDKDQKKTEKAEKPADDFQANWREQRYAKTEYYRRYYPEFFPKKRYRHRGPRPKQTQVLWHLMPDPPPEFVKEYTLQQRAKYEERLKEEAKKKKTIPGLKGVPGISGR